MIKVILYPSIALLISVIMNLYITIYSNPYLMYFELSSDSNLTYRVYYNNGDGYKKQNYKVINIIKNTEFKKHRVVVPFDKLTNIKFANFNTRSNLKIQNNIFIFNKINNKVIKKIISFENSRLINHDSKELTFKSKDEIIEIHANINLKGFEIDFEESTPSWVIKDLLQSDFYYNTFKYFLLIMLFILSFNINIK
jgi:hypothetical protein